MGVPQTWVDFNGLSSGLNTWLLETVDVLWVVVCVRGEHREDMGRQGRASIASLGSCYPHGAQFLLFFLLLCRFPSSSGAGGSVTLVRGGILGRENACGSAVLCPRALPGYLL